MGAESSTFDPIFAFRSFAEDFRLILNCITSQFNICNLKLTHKTSSISSVFPQVVVVIVDRCTGPVRTASSRFIVHSVSLEKESATCNEEVLGIYIQQHTLALPPCR